VAVALFVPACVALTWWQVARAVGGNTLSWVYSFEWPVFAAYALYMWWKLLHEEPTSEAGRARPRPRAGTKPGPEAEAESRADGQGGQSAPEDELAAYNRYLAELNASGKQKRW
jgi:hypothetical protein